MTVTLDDDVIPGLLPDGRPDPHYAASLGLVPATPGRRSAAFAIDLAVFVMLGLPVSIGALPLAFGINADRPPYANVWLATVNHPDYWLALILFIVGEALVTIFVVVQLLVHGAKGLTMGKAMVGLRSINVVTLGKPGIGRILLRGLVFGAAFVVVPYLGVVPFLLSPLWDPQKRGRGWLDKVGKSWLVDVRRGTDPYDVKAMRHARRALTAPLVAEQQELPSLATGTAWAGPTFVPATRSSSGVVSHAPAGEPAPQWDAPAIGMPAEPVAPIAPSVTPPAAPVERRTVAPAAPVAESRPAAPLRTPVLLFDDGLTLAVRGNGLLGRAPEAQPGERVEHLYSIDDPARQLSKTHLAFGIDAHGVWIMDRGSSNGTYVTIGAGAAFALEVGKPHRIGPGAVVEIGDRTFTVKDVP